MDVNLLLQYTDGCHTAHRVVECSSQPLLQPRYVKATRWQLNMTEYCLVKWGKETSSQPILIIKKNYISTCTKRREGTITDTALRTDIIDWIDR